jgi:hypothetical protein
LTSWQRADGTSPFGDDPVGVLSYGSDGRMSVLMAASNRPKLGIPIGELARARSVLMRPWMLFGNRDVVRGLGRFIKAASSFMAYAGTYEVRDGAVVHNVEVGSIPDWMGTGLPRQASLAGEVLTLKSPEGDTLRWRRIASAASEPGRDSTTEQTVQSV